MRAWLLLAFPVASTCMAQCPPPANPPDLLTIADQSAYAFVHLDTKPAANGGTFHAIGNIEWFVPRPSLAGGSVVKETWVYPGAVQATQAPPESEPPAGAFGISHFHADCHASYNQVHAVGASQGDMTIGIVYTIEGRSPDNWDSRLIEKIDVVSHAPWWRGIEMSGFGIAPSDPTATVSTDFRGTTVRTLSTLSNTSTEREVCAEFPMATADYGRLIVFPVVSFLGLNPTRRGDFVNIAPCGTLTIITELRVGTGLRRESIVVGGLTHH